MNTITGYGAYQSNYYNSAVQDRKEKSSTQETKKTEPSENDTVKMSAGAKKLLKELQQKYSNMDFMVGAYETEEEAASYLSRGTKEYSVLIDPEELEKMAADQETKDKNLELLDDAVGQLSNMKEELGDKEGDVKRLGVSIGENGTLTFFADLEKSAEQQKDRIEKANQAKKEDKAAAEKKKKAHIEAESAEELLKKIRELKWDNIKEETTTAASRFDCSI